MGGKQPKALKEIETLKEGQPGKKIAKDYSEKKGDISEKIQYKEGKFY